jgi:hypothetical protein
LLLAESQCRCLPFAFKAQSQRLLMQHDIGMLDEDRRKRKHYFRISMQSIDSMQITLLADLHRGITPRSAELNPVKLHRQLTRRLVNSSADWLSPEAEAASRNGGNVISDGSQSELSQHDRV